MHIKGGVLWGYTLVWVYITRAGLGVYISLTHMHTHNVSTLSPLRAGYSVTSRTVPKRTRSARRSACLSEHMGRQSGMSAAIAPSEGISTWNNRHISTREAARR